MPESRIQPEQLSSFRARLNLNASLRDKPQLNAEQTEQLRNDANTVFNKMYTLGSRFHQVEDLDMFRNPGLTNISMTPFISITEGENQPAFSVFLDETRFVSFAGHNETGSDIIEPKKVVATLLFKIPEREQPIPVASFTAQEQRDGSLVCSEVGTNDDFFSTGEGDERRLMNQLEAVQQVGVIVDALDEGLKDVKFYGPTQDGQEGHIMVARDQKHGEKVLFIPHQTPPSNK